MALAGRDERRSRRRSERRESILQAAEALLLCEGAAALTLSAVARQANLVPSALYYWFTDKEAIAEALAERAMIPVSVRMEAVVRDALSGVEALCQFVQTTVAYYTERAEDWRLLFQGLAALHLPEASRERVMTSTGRVFAALARRLQEDREAERLHPDVHPRKMTNVGVGIRPGHSGNGHGGRVCRGSDPLFC